jgi:hypothetical protein
VGAKQDQEVNLKAELEIPVAPKVDTLREQQWLVLVPCNASRSHC